MCKVVFAIKEGDLVYQTWTKSFYSEEEIVDYINNIDTSGFDIEVLLIR